MNDDAIEPYIEDWRRVIFDATGDDSVALRAIELAGLNGLFDPAKAVLADSWQPIETLHRIDTQIVLWNPCDGVHTLPVTIGLADLDALRRGGMFTHWRRLEGPDPSTSHTRPEGTGQ